MHEDEEEIRLENMSKIEGHGSLDIKIKDKKVKYVKLKITENKRFYTQAIRGKPAMSLPALTSRICGTCSIAHLTCCTKAVEDAFGYVPSEQTTILRKLSMYGMMIRDHALHLYVFAMPDLFGKDSILDFEGSDEELVRKAFAIKSAGNNLSKVIAGRAVHATFSEVGRFNHIPSNDMVKPLIEELKSVRGHAIDFIEMFYNSDLKVERDVDFVAMMSPDYSYLDGDVQDSTGFRVLGDKYNDYLEKVVIPYSESSGYDFKGREYMVGALSRMNLNRNNLNSDTKKDAGKFMDKFPSKNIYHNNLAQTIEVLHCIDQSIDLLEGSEFKEETNEPVVEKAGEGIGMIEAPRGILYYMLTIDNSGKVQYGRIIVPTSQNQICMEKSIAQLVQDNIDKDKAQIEYEIEKLIRAFDPCMSCASHFLKVKWI